MSDSNKTVLITGSSRGIGAATALLAAQKGYNVCLNYNKNEASATSIVRQINDSGKKAKAYRANIAHEKEIMSMFKKIDSDFGALNALVNNAGILETQSKVENMGSDRLFRIFKINTIGAFICSREAIRRMSISKGGSGGNIVNVSSIAAITGSPNEYVDYAASKAALDALTTGLSKEAASEGIRVNCVRPGYIYTDIHTDGGESNRIDRLKENIPMKRGGNPNEVARAILWLLSEESSYSTGAFINVAGGR